MGFKCCVPGCKTGYFSTMKVDTTKTTLFGFPKDATLRESWVKAIPRKDWTVSDTHKVCAKHFHEEDFIQVSSDIRKNRRLARDSQELKRLRIKSTSVPKVFPELPGYLSKPSSSARATFASTASARRNVENERIQQQNQTLLQQDVFDNFASLKAKLKDAHLPSGFVTVFEETAVIFHYVKYAEDFASAPQLLGSVVVTESLKVTAFVSLALVPPHLYKHLLQSQSLKTTSELANILAFCKSIMDEQDSKNTSNRMNFISIAASALQTYLSAETLPDCGDDGHSDASLLMFICEQLNLLLVAKQGRRYSSNLITVSYLWQLTSTSLYKILTKFFILPSIRRLQQLSVSNTVNGGQIDVQYIKQRTASLRNEERIVTLMIDEVYTAQRIEYSNGAFVGLTEDGTPAKTVLTFMVQSTCGKYKDVICLIPVNKLDTKLQRFWFNKIMVALHDILVVIAVSVDNHVCNRKMFMDLCGGKLSHSIVHPTKPDERLFLLFDFTHNFKNIFNNFVNKNRMHIPTAGHENILGEICTPLFDHVKRLYSIEEHKTLKIAHTLKKASLNPSNLARTSPLHALSIHKRDEMCEPMRTDEHSNHTGLVYLAEALQIFKTWKQSGFSGLTAETFTACIQSMGAVPELAAYLQDSMLCAGMIYLLPVSSYSCLVFLVYKTS